MTTIKLKNDKYKKSRGGYSKLLNIQCAKCGNHLFFYQKDGPGILKRMYLDRIFASSKYSDLSGMQLRDIPQLECPYCNELVGIPYIYEKEQRLAYRLLLGKVTKKIVKQK